MLCDTASRWEDAAIRARGLTKAYASTRAVDGVDLDVAPGEVRGLLGANGAGKTTLLRMLFGLVRPDAGSVELFGRAPGEGLPDGVAGFVEEPRFYPYLSGRANLELLAELDGAASARRIADALETVRLTDRAGDRVGAYSSGMRQRLGIGAALLRAPRLLLLDEPTTGLDPAGARDVRALLQRLRGRGVAMLLSSHQIGEVEELCDSFTMLREGAVVWNGTAEQLSDEAPASAYALSTSDDGATVQLAGGEPTVHAVHSPLGDLTVTTREETLDAFLLRLAAAGVAVRRLERLASPLESMFFALTADPGSEPVPDLLVGA